MVCAFRYFSVQKTKKKIDKETLVSNIQSTYLVNHSVCTH